MPTYLAQRQDQRWVVLRGTTIVGTYASGSQGAQQARQAAANLNAAETRRESRDVAGGATVRTWRHRLGLSQARLAEQLGVALFTVQRWESGESEPPAYLFLAFERLEQLL